MVSIKVVAKLFTLNISRSYDKLTVFYSRGEQHWEQSTSLDIHPYV